MLVVLLYCLFLLSSLYCFILFVYLEQFLLEILLMLSALMLLVIMFFFFLYCYDNVDWVTGRATGLKKYHTSILQRLFFGYRSNLE